MESGTLTCTRCGRPATGKRCMACGGITAPSTGQSGQGPKNAGEGRPQRRPAPSPEPGPQPTEEPRSEGGRAPQPVPAPPAMTVDPRLAKVDEEIGAINRQLDALGVELGRARLELARSLGGLLVDVRAQQSTIDRQCAAREAEMVRGHQEVQARHERELKIMAARQGNGMTGLGSSLASQGQELAARSARRADQSLTSDDLCPALGVRELVRLGDLRFPNASRTLHAIPSAPAVLPLVNQGHVVVEGSSGDPECQGIITDLVAQAFMSAPAGQLVVTVFDPRMRDLLGGFAAHGAATDAKILTKVHPSPQDLDKALADHINHMLAVNDSKAQQFATMGDMVAATGQHEHQYRVLVVMDFPFSWSQRSAQDLQRIIDQGAASGVSVILHHDPAEVMPRDVDVERITQAAAVVRKMAGTWTLSPARGRLAPVFVPSAPLQLDAIRREMELLAKAAEEGSLPKVSFMDLLRPGTGWWDGGKGASSADGLRILLGKSGNREVGFTLGDTLSNLHNVLVGGRAGSGKTVLLKAMIYSLAAQYAPDELRLFLLDYKEGVEFQQFLQTSRGNIPLPHVDVVSIESDADFGLAVLAHFESELQRRSQLFKAAGNVPNLKEYRRRFPDQPMPRWVLFVDEFQGMFVDRTNREATRRVEDIVRRGRSFGLHLVLASQTISGIRFDGDKDKAIFENIPARIVLQIGPEEAKKFLQSTNDGASKLRYRGQAILNKAAGAPTDNEQFVVAFAEQEYEELQQRLAMATPVTSRRVPRVYRGDARTSGSILLGITRPAVVDGGLPAWFGQRSTVALQVASTRLATASGSNIAVLGSQDVAAAVATVQTIVLSAVTAQPGLDLFVLEALTEAQRQTTRTAEWIALLEAAGATVRTYDGDGVEDFVEVMKVAGESGSRGLFVLLGAENTDLRREVSYDWEGLARSLPRQGFNIVGQWSDTRDLPSDEYRILDDFKTLLFVGATQRQVELAAKVGRDQIPPLAPTRTLALTPEAPQSGLTSVASVAPLTDEDFAAWKRANRVTD